MRYESGNRTLKSVRAPLDGRCRYRVQVRINRHLSGGKLRVNVRFLGNALLAPGSSRTQVVRAA